VRSCPLCHRELEGSSAISFVPVSPIVYPGIEGLEVHSDCLAAARRGEFEIPLPNRAYPVIVMSLALLLAIAALIILL
jgi:hypothetical protein